MSTRQPNRIIATILSVCCVMMLNAGCEEQAATPERLDPSWFRQFEMSPEYASAPPMPPTYTRRSIKQPEPRIKFEKLTHNFGQVGLKSQNLCEFSFTNTGDGVLEIKQIVASCGSCTALEMEKGRYEPGESGTMKVKFYADTQLGQVTKNLTVYSNDRTNPNVTLAVTARVISKVQFEPRELHLLLEQANAGNPKITLTSTDGRPFAISHFKSTDDSITIDYDPSVKKMKFVIEPKINVARLADNMNGRIEIGLTHPECQTVTMNVKTVPKFVFNPVMVRGVNPGESFTRKVRIINNYHENFDIVSVESIKGAAIVLDTHAIGNGYELNIQIKSPDDKNMRIFTDTLVVKTGSGDRLEIPCNVFLAKAAPQSSKAEKSKDCKTCGPRIIYKNRGVSARGY